MPEVRDVYVVTTFFKDLASLLKEAIDQSAYCDTIKVIELKTKGYYTTTEVLEEDQDKIPLIEIMVGDPDVISKVFLHPGSRLKWAQSLMAGADLFFERIRDSGKVPDFVYTRRGDVFSRMMPEYVIGHIIARERHFSTTYEHQKARHFPNFDLRSSQVRMYRTLDSLSIGILGFGVIGKQVAKQCKHFDMTVWATVRDERFDAEALDDFEDADHVIPMSRLDEMLSKCDYIVSVLPSTPETKYLLSGDVLKACRPKKSVLINVGRGDLISEASLVNAINNEWLGGAILDVFEEEPLPPSSPLWTLPGVTITPHSSASGLTTAGFSEMFMENLRLYQEDKPLKYKIDWVKGY